MRVREVNLPSAGGIGPVESRASTARSITSYGTQFYILLFADDGFGGPSVRVISCFPYPDNDNDTGMIKHYITQSRQQWIIVWIQSSAALEKKTEGQRSRQIVKDGTSFIEFNRTLDLYLPPRQR